jgi:hypothetical protein
MTTMPTSPSQPPSFSTPSQVISEEEMTEIMNEVFPPETTDVVVTEDVYVDPGTTTGMDSDDETETESGKLRRKSFCFAIISNAKN